MKKEIILNIIGTQKVDNQKDKIEITTVGYMDEDETSYTVHYTEEQEPPSQSVDAAVRIYKDNSAVEMTRTGAYDSCLIIERSKRNLCQYGTEYGDLLMGIMGKIIESDVDKNRGSFHFRYDIDVNGALTSQNEVQMTYKENDSQEQ